MAKIAMQKREKMVVLIGAVVVAVIVSQWLFSNRGPFRMYHQSIREVEARLRPQDAQVVRDEALGRLRATWRLRQLRSRLWPVLHVDRALQPRTSRADERPPWRPRTPPCGRARSKPSSSTWRGSVWRNSSTSCCVFTAAKTSSCWTAWMNCARRMTAVDSCATWSWSLREAEFRGNYRITPARPGRNPAACPPFRGNSFFVDGVDF